MNIQWNPDFLNLSGEKEIGSNYLGVWKIGGKITVFDWGREASFGSNYWEFSETESLRNQDSTVCYYNANFFFSPSQIPPSPPYLGIAQSDKIHHYLCSSLYSDLFKTSKHTKKYIPIEIKLCLPIIIKRKLRKHKPTNLESAWVHRCLPPRRCF